MAIEQSLRQILNQGDPGQIAAVLQELKFGDLLNAMLSGGSANLPALASVQEATADAATQTGSYVQADVQSIRTLANSLKAKYNTLQADVVAMRAGLAGAGAATEIGLVPSSQVVTMAATPSSIVNVNLRVAGSGGSTGFKKLRRGRITGSQAVLPVPGEAVWDGATKLLLNAADIGTGGSPVVDVEYTKTTDATISALQGVQGGLV
jgi:hypothetical protein